MNHARSMSLGPCEPMKYSPIAVLSNHHGLVDKFMQSTFRVDSLQISIG